MSETTMKLHRAIQFSANSHKGQVRKGTDTPYIVHPLEVALILAQYNWNEDVICAGLLHDVVEDTSVTIDEIKEMFGEKVAAFVSTLTEDKNKSWEERKQHTISQVKKLETKEELLLLCADKLANLRSMKADLECLEENLFWSRFSRGKEKQKWYYSELLKELQIMENHPIYKEMQRLYCEIFKER